MNKLFFLLAFLFIYHTGSCQTAVKKVETAKSLEGMRAGVACAHPIAAEIGAKILAQGGNAIDAAIAVEWALAVCYPRAGNIGGGGFMIVRMNDGTDATLDFREEAPAAATATMYQDSIGNLIEGLSLDTHLAAGVPGSVRGIFDSHEKYGKLPMNELIEPAIELAEKGFRITQNQADLLNETRDQFNQRNRFKTPFQKSEKWMEGDSIIQNDLANTLRRIAANGVDEFYSGRTAQLIADEMKAGGGIITIEDLRNYKTFWRKPVYATFEDYKIISMPPPSSGGVALAQLLTLWDLFGNDSIKHNSPAYIHLITEFERRVYADRATHMGDPDFYNVPQAGLMNRDYLKSRMSDYNPKVATPSSEVSAGKPALAESSETTHLSVVDAEGNAVSITTTLNGNFGCKIMVKGAGFFLNNEMDDFSSKPGAPNMFGLIGGKANSIAPGKRMLSSMTPTIVEKNGQLFLVVGSPGGSTIITSVFQTIMNTAVFDMNLADAIAAPKFHSQWLPDAIYLEENRFDPNTINSLIKMGHQVDFFPSLGRVDAIEVNPDKTLEVCGDPRADDTAAGY